ncbi:hypothetical protein [Dactylosporangium sp. CA-092794]|uniref:hypothetical protein n=1 Tax=Dactylosporangium sp. CA-092794 TaxID=3239929 RepID=UPI003D904919
MQDNANSSVLLDEIHLTPLDEINPVAADNLVRFNDCKTDDDAAAAVPVARFGSATV